MNVDDLVDRLGAREPGRLAVPAAARAACAIADTSISSLDGSQADPARRVGRLGRLADRRRQLGPLDRAQVVDDPLGVLLPHAELVEVAPQQVRDDEPPAVVDLRPLERAREQLQLRELDRLVDALEDALDVDARLDELGREPERLRRRVRVLEAAGVGDERDVERLGDRGRQRDVELARAGRGRSRRSTTRPRRRG